MADERLVVGDPAPDFTLMAARGDEVSETSLRRLLEGNRGVVLSTYALDFTGG
jgi:peroxiredoxin